MNTDEDDGKLDFYSNETKSFIEKEFEKNFKFYRWDSVIIK